MVSWLALPLTVPPEGARMRVGLLLSLTVMVSLLSGSTYLVESTAAGASMGQKTAIGDETPLFLHVADEGPDEDEVGGED